MLLRACRPCRGPTCSREEGLDRGHHEYDQENDHPKGQKWDGHQDEKKDQQKPLERRCLRQGDPAGAEGLRIDGEDAGALWRHEALVSIGPGESRLCSCHWELRVQPVILQGFGRQAAR